MQKGFSMIELVIVVAIIGIIAAIAIPSYNGYLVRTNRTAVQTEMVRISQDLQRYQVANRNSFAGATLATANAKASFPEGKAYYDLALSVGTNGKGWTLTATPKTGTPQDGDGAVVLNHRGEKCWTKGGTCTPSASTKW